MPIVGLSYIENLILDTGIAGILTDLLLIESEEEDKAVAFASTGSLINDNSVWILIPENSANDKRTVIMIRQCNLNFWDYSWLYGIKCFRILSYD